MTEEVINVSLKVIGTVRNGLAQRPDSGWGEAISEIVINSQFTEALDGLEELSHITVIFWMHQVMSRGPMPSRIHPMGKPELPLVGRFATRSPHRPNPLGETVVRLLERRDNVLKVEGLDAFEGTPVIDIKPFLPGHDSVADARAPSWIPEH